MSLPKKISAESAMKLSLTSLQKKAKERTVKTQAIEYDLETLVKKIVNNIIRIDPVYQRNHRWNPQTSSRLIESLILNIPVPIIYLSIDVDVDDVQSDVARYSVIDGQQRLTAIRDFFRNELTLVGLKSLSELNGCTFEDLPPFLVRRLEERSIKCLRIDSTVDPQVKYDIFERLNSGAVALNAQELRNAAYRGSFNEKIKELATNQIFMTLLQIDPAKAETSTKVRKMDDVEHVLRFFALGDGYHKQSSGKMKDFLDRRMESFQKLDKDVIEEMGEQFIRSIELINDMLGETAFAKYRYDGDDDEYTQMSSFNVAVYDAIAVAVGNHVGLGYDELPDDFADGVIALFEDEDFFDSVDGNISDRSKVTTRIDAVAALLAEAE